MRLVLGLVARQMEDIRANFVAVTDDQPTIPAPRPDPKKDSAPRRLGLSGKLLLLTIPLVMIAGLMIYVPAIANFRMNRLNDRIAAASTAALVLDAAPSGMVPDSLARQILKSVGARAVAIKMGQQRRLLASADLPAAIDHDVDMRTLTVWSAIVDSFETMLETGNHTIRVVGPAPGGGQFIEAVIDELPLRQAMYRFSRNLLVVSLGIAALAALLVYLTLHYLFVRPMRRLTANLIGFHENPESSARIITPSQRGDEIGVAERELSDMQRDLVSMLHQKSRLAALGLAVSKINHDLRNLLASSQLLSDQLASVPDPQGAALCAETDALAGARHRVLPVDTLLWPRAGSRPRPPHDSGRACGRRGARIRRPCRRRLDRLDQRDRARACDRRRSRPAVSCAAQSGAQRGAGAGKPAEGRCGGLADSNHRPPRRRGRDHRGVRHRSRRSGAGARASVRGVPDLRAARRQRAWALRSPPNWSAPMAATSIWSRAPSAPPSGSRFRTGRWNCKASATSGRGRNLPVLSRFAAVFAGLPG